MAISYRRLTWGYKIRVFVLTKGISVVGPRPALPKEVDKYTDYQLQRLLVKPGITCYWQTRRDRDSITFDEWVDLDLCLRSRITLPHSLQMQQCMKLLMLPRLRRQ